MPGKEDGPPPTAAEILSIEFGYTAPIILAIVLAGVAGLFIIYNVVDFCAKYLRTLVSMNSDTQKNFAKANPVSELKRHVFQAPLFGHRLNRNFAVGKANMGTLTSRPHTILLTALVGLDIFLLLWDQPFPLASQDISLLANRAGTLALTNAVPLFLFAGRKNPLITLTGIDFNAFNVMHRWIGRIAVSLILVHGISFIYKFSLEGGGSAVIQTLTQVQYIARGFGAIICWVLLTALAGPTLRKAFYETFLVTHQVLVATSLVLLRMHLAEFWQSQILTVMIICWIVDRSLRLLDLVYHNVGGSGTKILAEALPGEAMRITIYTARSFKVKPGSHLFLYVPSVGLWTNHPFSVAWSETHSSPSDPDSYDIEKDGLVISSRSFSQEASMSLVVKKRGGMTATLYNKVVKAGGVLSCRALIEGPYGGMHNLDSYGTVLMFAGGVGITHHVPYVRHLVAGFADRTVACRKLVLVWAVQSSEHLEWVRPWMTTILGMEGRRDLLRILIFVTKPDRNNPASLDVQSPSQSVQMFPGRRPDVASIIGSEATDQVGAMAVSVCGSGPLSDDVRAEARRRMAFSNVDLYDEAFSW